MGPFRRDRISRDAPVVLAQSLSGGMANAVVDAERYVMVVGAELHPDEQVRARIRDVVSRLVAD